MYKILLFCCSLLAFSNCGSAQNEPKASLLPLFQDNRLNDILEGNLKEDEAAADDLFKAITEKKPQHLATAQKAQVLANQYIASIEKARQVLFTAAGGPHPEHPDRPLKYKDKDITTQLFVTEGLGEKLYQEGLVYKNAMIEICKNDKKHIKWLNENLLEDNADVLNQKQSWAENHFKQMPVAAVMPTFAKMKNDAKLAQVLIFKYLLEN